MDILYGWLGVGGVIFWVSDVGGHFLWLCGYEWRLVEVYFGWVGICGNFCGWVQIGGGVFWVGGNGWTFFICGCR